MNSPMLVTARMGEPVITYGDGLHLDGILAWAAYRDLTEEQRYEMPPISTAWALDFDLPIARWSVDGGRCLGADKRLLDEHGRVWGWLATQALADWEKHSIHEVRKRVPLEELARWADARTVHIGCGPAKAYDLGFPTQWAPTISWFAIGDPAEVERLLRTHVYGIGKHCAKGLGRVLEWGVEPADVDEAFIIARRRMACSESEATSIMSIRPPYHHNSRHTYARDPG